MAEIVGGAKYFSGAARNIARHFFRNENAALVVILTVLIAVMAAVTKGLTTNALRGLWDARWVYFS